MPTVLSIQSSVAHGHVGNSAADFCLRRLGCDLARIDTVRFSNHPAHGGFTGAIAKAAEIDALVDGLARHGFLGRCDALLSGYLGSAENGAAIGRTLDALRSLRADALYMCDPVMGDRPQGVFVRPDVPDAIHALVARADIVTPNSFELGLLTDMPAVTAAEAAAAARVLLGRMAGRVPPVVIVTGLEDAGRIGALCVTPDRARMVMVPRIAAPAFGAGDSFTAILLGRLMEHPDPVRATRLAVESLHAVLDATRRLGLDELALVAAQDAIVRPPERSEIVTID